MVINTEMRSYKAFYLMYGKMPFLYILNVKQGQYTYMVINILILELSAINFSGDFKNPLMIR